MKMTDLCPLLHPDHPTQSVVGWPRFHGAALAYFSTSADTTNIRIPRGSHRTSETASPRRFIRANTADCVAGDENRTRMIRFRSQKNRRWRWCGWSAQTNPQSRRDAGDCSSRDWHQALPGRRSLAVSTGQGYAGGRRARTHREPDLPSWSCEFDSRHPLHDFSPCQTGFPPRAVRPTAAGFRSPGHLRATSPPPRVRSGG
jgi:hypothetical protein